jgi:hypothetical protein
MTYVVVLLYPDGRKRQTSVHGLMRAATDLMLLRRQQGVRQEGVESGLAAIMRWLEQGTEFVKLAPDDDRMYYARSCLFATH